MVHINDTKNKYNITMHLVGMGLKIRNTVFGVGLPLKFWIGTNTDVVLKSL